MKTSFAGVSYAGLVVAAGIAAAALWLAPLPAAGQAPGGKGGGKAEMAQGGTNNLEALDKAVESVYDIVNKAATSDK